MSCECFEVLYDRMGAKSGRFARIAANMNNACVKRKRQKSKKAFWALKKREPWRLMMELMYIHFFVVLATTTDDFFRIVGVLKHPPS